MSLGEHRPPPEWLGDVSAGVDAWTRRAGSAETVAEEHAPASAPTPPSRRSRGRRTPPPEDTAAQVPEADPESVARKILLDHVPFMFERTLNAARGADAVVSANQFLARPVAEILAIPLVGVIYQPTIVR